MIHFGPAGNCERFYAEGFKSSEQAPGWIAAQGLTAYEYSAGHGLALGEEKALAIGAAARKAQIVMSVHAPYYINCGNPEKIESNAEYLLSAARAVSLFGGNRVIFHPGSPGKLPREKAMETALQTLRTARSRLDDAGLSDIYLCPETMGRPSQLGTLDEILLLCAEIDRTIPTVDFGHLHAFGCGCMTDQADFERVLDRMIEALGFERVRHFHSHFSRISYTAKGERCHMTFADTDYGPDFSHLAPALKKYGLEPTIICESRGTQADDALTMMKIYASCEA